MNHMSGTITIIIFLLLQNKVQTKDVISFSLSKNSRILQIIFPVSVHHGPLSFVKLLALCHGNTLFISVFSAYLTSFLPT